MEHCRPVWGRYLPPSAQWSPDGLWIACATGGGAELVSPDGKK